MVEIIFAFFVEANLVQKVIKVTDDLKLLFKVKILSIVFDFLVSVAYDGDEQVEDSHSYNYRWQEEHNEVIGIVVVNWNLT